MKQGACFNSRLPFYSGSEKRQGPGAGLPASTKTTTRGRMHLPVSGLFTSTTKGRHKMNAKMHTSQTERITLYYREGSSDKVYQASIEPRGESFVVNFAFGRRDSTLQPGTKTSEPVDYDSAKKIYDRLVREKKAKGYTEGPDE